ncbi:MAG: sialate O-acetylesterase [Bacteroidales bacterium]|nr:sialate O-acetylesterase [Bacteroidales bacterium]
MNLLLIHLLALVMPQIFSDNMILQQGRNLPVWGQADPAAAVQVTLFDEATGKSVAKVKGKADREGNWKLQLPSLKAEGQQLKMVVVSKKDELQFTGIAVGEVWVCSGQSNMAYAMRRGTMAPPRKGEDLAALELEKPANPAIRVFLCGGRPGSGNSWKIADGQSIAPVSAVGYFFAKNLTEALGVPVGIISASSGGSLISQWMETGMLYNSQLKPLTPFAVGGFLWYQGESDLALGTKDYASLYVQLTSSWRAAFESPDAPFYSVLICPHTYSDRMHHSNFVTSEGLPLFWQEQLKAVTAAGNGEAIFNSDLVDNLEDIHPSYKWIVGARLAKLALADKYKVENAAEWSGPRATELRIEGGKAIVKFTHCAEGLKGKSNSVEPNSIARLKWFEVAGKDGIWHQAFAEIVGTDEVAVTHPDVPAPVSVRFAWRETAQPNLFNSEGLPAFPFILQR